MASFTKIKVNDNQWRNRRGGGGGGVRGQSAPKLLNGKFLLTYREKRVKGIGVKIERKRRKFVKGKVKKLKKLQIEDFFSSHFSKPLKFVLGLPNGNFLSGKSISRREKNQEK